MITISAKSHSLDELRKATTTGNVDEITKAVNLLIEEKNEDIKAFNHDNTPLLVSLKKNCIDGLIEVKDELKDIKNALKKLESPLSARRFKILEWARQNYILKSNEDLMVTKGRRFIAREIHDILSSDFSKREKHENRGKPESMEQIDLLDVTIDQMCNKILNISSANASIQRELDKVGQIVENWEKRSFDDSGKLALRQLRDILEAEPFTDKHNPNIPVITQSL